MPARLVIRAGIDALTRNEYKDIFIESLKHCSREKGMQLNAWILMTNHVHLIMSAKKDFIISNILRDLKKYTSKQIVQAIKENSKESRREWMIVLLPKLKILIVAISFTCSLKHIDHPFPSAFL